jgi:hypothetical protein
MIHTRAGANIEFSYWPFQLDRNDVALVSILSGGGVPTATQNGRSATANRQLNLFVGERADLLAEKALSGCTAVGRAKLEAQ